MPTIAERYRDLLERIDRAARGAGRRGDEIELVAVSKTVPPALVREAWRAGVRTFGENRAQELRRKAEDLTDLAVTWHFIGHLQTNKVKMVVPRAAVIQSVDRLGLAQKIADRMPAAQQQSILVQVNTSAEETKSGVAPEGLSELLDAISHLPALRVDGLMTIGPLTGDRAAIGRAFARLRRAIEQERRAGRPHAPLRHLSMGMTADFELAIAEGATMIRVGTALFGQRPTPP